MLAVRGRAELCGRCIVNADQLRANLERRKYPTLSRLALTLLRALRENPTWCGETPSWLATALRARESTDHKPARHEVVEALEELREEKQRRREAREAAA